MARDWFAPHAAGFGPLVAGLVARDEPGSRLLRSEDNGLFFSCETEPASVLSYCRGLFRVLGEHPAGLERAAAAFARDQALFSDLERWDVPRRGDPRRGDPRRDVPRRGPATFVLRTFGPDDPASIPIELRRGLEAALARATGMRPDSVHPEREFRIQERAEGRTLLLERIAPARGASSAGEPERRGELPRTTCRLLAEMTGPLPGDVFLDPFCGYGGIVLERALAAPYCFAFASDSDPEKIQAVKAALAGKAFERRRKTIFPKLRDALDSSAFEAGFVSAIATDPPWGIYEGGPGGGEAADLLASFMFEAARLLAPGGRLVLLVAREALLGPCPDFLPRASLDVLVSGKKAKALRLERR
jgi:SAM-dependent methyltransferase